MARQKLARVKDAFHEKLGKFSAFLDVARGKVDVKNRVSLILNPENPRTSSRLSRNAVDFVSLSYFIADYFPEFEPLREYAKNFTETSLSLEGFGIDSVIRLNAAINEQKWLSKLGIATKEEKPLVGKA